MTIDTDIKKANRLVIDAAEKTIRATALKLFGAIIDDTPVDEGRLRGNWQTELNLIPTGVVDDIDPQGQTTLKAADRELNKFDIKDTITFTNNLPYADVIENGNSKITGHFMVKRAVASFTQALDQAARRNKVK